MAKEIERKFLVKNDLWKESVNGMYVIQQGYLAKDKNTKTTVRVRIRDDGAEKQAFVTIKGKRKGISRDEFEFEIPVKEANGLLDLSIKPTIVKHRYLVSSTKAHPNGYVEYHTWEVDEFMEGPNKGLVMAEIELDGPREKFPKPSWVGKEVSQDDRYSNSYLTSHKVPRK